ncbi:hypothetical protein LN893_09785 [Pontibacter sp. XAAS-A31]|nr:hypothetical protein [Pontibacter harenae]
MTEQVQQRIKILESFNAGISWQSKTHEQKRKRLFWLSTAHLVVTLILLFVLLWFTTRAILGIEVARWDKMGLLVLMSVSFFLRAPAYFVGYLLQKNIQRTQAHKVNLDVKLTEELAETISRMNSRKRRILLMLPSVVLSVAAILQVFELNSYWSVFRYFTLFYCFFFIVRTILEVSTVNRIFKKVNSVG